MQIYYILDAIKLWRSCQNTWKKWSRSHNNKWTSIEHQSNSIELFTQFGVINLSNKCSRIFSHFSTVSVSYYSYPPYIFDARESNSIISIYLWYLYGNCYFEHICFVIEHFKLFISTLISLSQVIFFLACWHLCDDLLILFQLSKFCANY